MKNPEIMKGPFNERSMDHWTKMIILQSYIPLQIFLFLFFIAINFDFFKEIILTIL